jgi:glutamine---fructose-6-phosphate transaminase (isomerizing)
MCGISGCLLSETNNASRAVVDALIKLQNRGYDSAGFCVVYQDKILIEKSVSAPGENAMNVLINSDLLNLPSQISIGHTRWATHGGKTLENTHPHHDDTRQLALVHNGIIENYQELRQELIDIGFAFYGETDTEVATKYYHHLSKTSGSIHDLTGKLRGSWAILATFLEHQQTIFYTKSGSPLILGFNQSRTKAMFVSELSGFDSDIVQYTVIKDGDSGFVSVEDGICVLNSRFENEFSPMTAEIIETSPTPYPHWTIKEIHDQSRVLKTLIHENAPDGRPIIPGLNQDFRDKLEKAKHLIFLGCGTSYNAAQVGLHYFKTLNCKKTFSVIDGADFEYYDVADDTPTILILLSQSGETKDLHRALQIKHPSILGSLGIVNVENSLIARETDCCLYLRAGREQAVASTKSFTNQVTMLILIALSLSDFSDTILSPYYQAICDLPSDYHKTIISSSDQIQKLLPYFENQTSCFVLGKHASEWIAREGALKIKEISYIHAEGFSAAALKHGPFALLDVDVPVILMGNETYQAKLENVAMEVQSRNARVIHINNHPTSGIFIDTTSTLFPLISVIPLQILAYQLALARGNNPDYPRNLAKVVTVE